MKDDEVVYTELDKLAYSFYKKEMNIIQSEYIAKKWWFHKHKDDYFQEHYIQANKILRKQKIEKLND